MEPYIALHSGHKAQYIDTKSGNWVTDQTDEVGGDVDTLSRQEIVNICKRVSPIHSLSIQEGRAGSRGGAGV